MIAETRRWTNWLLAFVIAVAVGGGYFMHQLGIAATAVGAAAALCWFCSNEHNLRWYAATIGLLLPQDVIVARLSIADVCASPAIFRTGLDGLRRRTLPHSTMIAPFCLLTATFVIATIVEYRTLGHVTSWTLFNKDTGLILQVLVFAALAATLTTPVDVRHLVRWFVAGVVISNIAALFGVAAAFSGIPNPLY